MPFFSEPPFNRFGRSDSSSNRTNPHHVPKLPQFGQIKRLAVDTRRDAAHKNAAFRAPFSPHRVDTLRLLLVIGGLVVAAIAIFAVWVFIPKTPATNAAPTIVAQAQETPQVAAPAENAAENGSDAVEGEGSLRVCNQTLNPVSIALGYRAPNGWQSEGWWVAQANECKTVYNGKLDARYYYIYAADDIGGGSWDGANYMCTRDETFTIFGVEDCLARGYERTGFFEIDTQNRSNWMLQLTDGEVLGAEPVDGTDDIPIEGTPGAGDAQPAMDEPTGTEGDTVQ
jgi:uncharacterized membrane protein